MSPLNGIPYNTFAGYSNGMVEGEEGEGLGNWGKVPKPFHFKDIYGDQVIDWPRVYFVHNLTPNSSN